MIVITLFVEIFLIYSSTFKFNILHSAILKDRGKLSLNQFINCKIFLCGRNSPVSLIENKDSNVTISVATTPQYVTILI